MFVTITPQSVQLKLDDALFGATVTVPPSGDHSGEADSSAIQAAIDKVQATVTGTMTRGTVKLSGLYFTNRPLRIGDVKTAGCAALVGDREAGITYVGPQTNDYMVRVFGKGTGSATVLANLNLYGKHATRGALISYATTRSVIDRVQFHSTRQTALDLLNCWGMTVSNTTISTFRGAAMRGYNANACHFAGISVAGGKATEISDWAAEDDTNAIHYDGSPYRVVAGKRAAITIHGQGTLFSMLMLEAIRYDQEPLVYLANTDSFQFLMTRLEGNQNRLHKVVIDGGRFNVIDGVCTCDGKPLGGTDWSTPEPDTACETFVRCIGKTMANKLQRLAGNTGCTKGLLIHDSGEHVGNMVTECYSLVPYLRTTDQINEVNNPIVSSGFPG